MKKNAIALFDSGIGGLSVLKSLIDSYPEENFFYVGDLARLPYGIKSPETIQRYSIQVLKYLKRFEPKAIIIACNSASSVFLDQDEFEGVPLFNIIKPGMEELFSGYHLKCGVCATQATINSKSYEKLAEEFTADFFSQACPLFVPLVEEGLVEGEIVQLVCDRYLKSFKNWEGERLLLGCTHYPLLSEALEKYFSYKVELITPNQCLIKSLLKQNLLSSQKDRGLKIHLTDQTSRTKDLISSFLGSNISYQLETIDLV